MNPSSPFTIYNASAGSGKTFTIVKEYLKILFQSTNHLAFKNSLALTFTNKAVGEMKERIIDMLKAFSEEHILENPNSMFEVLVDELNIESKLLHEKSKVLLERIVHNYAAFDISTIDKFNHRLIRTFAYDLQLPVNFEVELDTVNILGKAVDRLIDKAGSEQELTRALVDFAIDKTDDDKSWNIAHDFNNVAKLLIYENDIPFLRELEDKTLQDFKTLRVNLQKQLEEVKSQVIDISNQVLELINRNHIEHNDFSSSFLPKYFIKLRDGNFNVSFSTKWQNDLIAGENTYPKRVNPEIAEAIERIQPELSQTFLATKDAVFRIKFLKNALKNITPLSVLTAIGKTLQEIKDEDDILLISEFNAIIHSEIQKQPAPFIYERIGEKFKHFFIDEFQDTSILQWTNLLPLIDNATSSTNLKGENGSLMLVGDAKQAIYRWRGGRAEQFIDLYTKQAKPLSVEQAIRNLPNNYRSHKTIVDFNNDFFMHSADTIFSNPKHQFIYNNAEQEGFVQKEGYVELSFLNIEETDKNELHCQTVLEKIQLAISHGYAFKDICIIIRKTKEGIAIAEFLSEENISIVSSETLLLQNSPEVQFINHLITYSLQPENQEIKIKLLAFIADFKLETSDKHSFLEPMIALNAIQLFSQLNTYGFGFNYAEFLQLPIYEAVESVIRGFNLNTSSNAYLQFYLDEVFDYSQKHNASFSGFLEFWNRKKDKLSIATPSGKNAIQIMTIHKSKGLEFPVVIFPFANQDIYADISPKVWFPVDKKKHEGFPYLYINMNKDLEALSEKGAELYQTYRSQLELDSLNLLYVVLTRAVEQLYVISEYDIDKKTQAEKLTHYSGLFINYLKSINRWNDQQLNYSFGDLMQRHQTKKITTQTLEQTQFISTKKEDHNLNILTNSGSLWDTAQEYAIERGNLIHQIMSMIKTHDDIEFALTHFLDLGQIDRQQHQQLKPLVEHITNHKKLSHLFESGLHIINERDIISKNGKIWRPDRVVINYQKEATIIDYKTGAESSKHQEQLFDYQLVLEEMNFKVIKKVLIYINDAIVIKEF
ncbi:ATP-dependent exoDNAse (exonuclease V) beta subunit (contains helicase and exonuclease domains) [Formosa sp. Hel1_31_208]|uniref:UvrD-helicase domain-containing protein n=1 Tax=Formosa sp. Hel1_31_208 TaxID=1798225 RepID=UPI00087BF965|nr:UvrD-helicase domain-containing protein [Formosa sp. Hel1_31_208]SDR71855.1 ATP-dependent exoDNAse (exonuclease V) beta subunit (contains helicase and exonuclease domains) [Formosa sp. Hel1_31_208]